MKKGKMPHKQKDTQGEYQVTAAGKESGEAAIQGMPRLNGYHRSQERQGRVLP